jgi:hypothetical protein
MAPLMKRSSPRLKMEALLGVVSCFSEGVCGVLKSLLEDGGEVGDELGDGTLRNIDGAVAVERTAEAKEPLPRLDSAVVSDDIGLVGVELDFAGRSGGNRIENSSESATNVELGLMMTDARD